MWNKYSFQPFIRNLSTMDHWFLCITQLLCTPGDNGHSFTPVNRQWPGFTCLSVTGHQRLVFLSLNSSDQGPHLFNSFSTNTAFRNCLQDTWWTCRSCFAPCREWPVFHVSLFSPSVSESLQGVAVSRNKEVEPQRYCAVALNLSIHRSLK